MSCSLALFIFSCVQTPSFQSFEEYPTSEDNGLGLINNGNNWHFKIWSPIASKAVVNFYENSSDTSAIHIFDMKRLDDGLWYLKRDDRVTGKFYSYQVLIDGEWSEDILDPYVKMVGVNGKRGFVGLPSEANPEGWSSDRSPKLNSPVDAIIYELQVRDFSIDETSEMKHKGKFLAFTELEENGGVSKGLAHLKELGVTHIHILPAFDFRSIDESRLDLNVFNWGYEPLHYNVPEGSFSTDPYDPRSRVQEFKSMVKSLHDQGLGVVLDVVYNHTGANENSNFNQLVPGYYYRLREDGSFSDASACGNETASDRYMFRKFMIESLKYWVEEYHLDGFRFDLMGIHDIETMNLISEELHEIKPDILLYGEGWTGGASPLPDSLRALKRNTYRLDKIAAFSDDLRDGLKGSVFQKEDTGFITGKHGTKESLKFGVVASTEHPQINYDSVNYSNEPWAAEPTQCVNYISCHDNMTLWDKLNASKPGESKEELIKIHKLANTIILTSQGIPFLHAGVEFMRSKNGVENSFESPDEINSIKWSEKEKNNEVFEYYKSLIELRKSHPAFRMRSTEEVAKNLTFLDLDDPLLLGFEIANNANGDEWEKIRVYYNGDNESKKIDLGNQDLTIVLDRGKINQDGLGSIKGEYAVQGRSALILHN